MRKTWGVLLALCMLLVTFTVTSSSVPAQATVTWPQEFADTDTNRVIANDSDNLSLLSCADVVRGDVAYQKLDGNVTTDSFPKNGNFSCNPNPYETDVQGPDGTVYGSYYDSSLTDTSYFAGIKNGRVKWVSNISADPDCVGAYGARNMTPQSVSFGPDGNIYMVTRSPFGGCAKYLVGLNANDGSEVLRVELSTGYGHGVLTKAWTYDDRIIVMDESGVKREFDYDGTENVSAQYSFSASNGGEAYANENGRVFFLSPSTSMWGSCTPGTIYYRDLNGSTASMSRIDGCGAYALAQIMALPDGKLAGYLGNGTVYVFNVTSATYSTISDPIPSGFDGGGSSYIVAYYMDEDKNTVFVRQLRQSSSSAVSTLVDYVDSSTSTVTHLYQRDGDGSPANTPEARLGDITDGYLYLPVSYAYSTSSPYERDVWIEKIDVGILGFGNLTEATFGYSVPLISVEYVAMGDSFSSGEGMVTFNQWTDRVGNDCHRSNQAYADLLTDSSYGLNLDLVDHVACSGATVTNVLGGQNDEGPQVDVLSSSTDVVTITLGGNDALFAAYAEGCIIDTINQCGPGSPYYEATMAIISDMDFSNNLETVYETILLRAPNAEVYVVGYPYVTPTNPSDPYCLPFRDYSTGSPVTDSVAARQVVDALNVTSGDVVTSIASSRLHFVDPTLSGNAFEDHDVCSSVPYFVYPLAPGAGVLDHSNWFHPNVSGQQAYADIIAEAIG